MQDVYIVGAVRTPIGKLGGELSSQTAVQLGIVATQAALNRSGLPKDAVDSVMIGNVIQAGGGQNPARQVSIKAGLPVSVPAMTLNAVCGSGLQSINLQAKLIMMGDIDVAVAGGMESMSNAPYLVRQGRFGYRFGPGNFEDSLESDALNDAFYGYPMGMTAENIADKCDVTRQQMDEYAYASQVKAVKAQKDGAFDDEIVPVPITDRHGKVTMVASDEAPRPNTSLEQMAKLKPAFKKDGRVTAGNASGLNDGAATVVLASAAAVKKYSLKPLAKWLSGKMTALDPAFMGLGPISAVRKTLANVNLTPDAIDCYEINEAFAAQMIPVMDALKVPASKVNPHGGAIALGHPVGASGARILVTLLYEMKQRNDHRGIATLCVGGGMGVAAAIER